ncbi:MAG: hypothetical protein ABSD41_03970 [Candidatus Bathyarchaeia archaeon]
MFRNKDPKQLLTPSQPIATTSQPPMPSVEVTSDEEAGIIDQLEAE